MSRAYRITVAESLSRHVQVDDGVCSNLEVLPILEKDRMGELLAAELEQKGFVREGDEADTAFIIDSGTCEVRQNGGPIAELGPGEIFGEAALLAGGTRIASVVAVTEVVTRVITRETLEAELGTDRWMGPLVRGLARRFHELSSENLRRF